MTEHSTMEPAEFCSRFAKRIAGIIIAAGGDLDRDIVTYAEQIAVTYWENMDQREEGPETCAEAEYGCWVE